MKIFYTINKLIFGLCLLAGVAAAAAGPQITVEVFAEKEAVMEENGQQVKKRVTAEAIQPGEIIFYTLKYSNSGDASAKAVVINDPIPEKTVYIAGSVTGDRVVFSNDGGKTYAAPGLLTTVYKNNKGEEKKRVASPEEYTHIRWVVDEIKAGQTGSVSFQVRVK